MAGIDARRERIIATIAGLVPTDMPTIRSVVQLAIELWEAEPVEVITPADPTDDQCTNCGLCCVTFENGVCGRCGSPIDSAPTRSAADLMALPFWPEGGES